MSYGPTWPYVIITETQDQTSTPGNHAATVDFVLEVAAGEGANINISGTAPINVTKINTTSFDVALTGTVPVANGGSGTTTAPTAPGQVMAAVSSSAYAPTALVGDASQITFDTSTNPGSITAHLPQALDPNASPTFVDMSTNSMTIGEIQDGTTPTTHAATIAYVNTQTALPSQPTFYSVTIEEPQSTGPGTFPATDATTRAYVDAAITAATPSIVADAPLNVTVFGNTNEIQLTGLVPLANGGTNFGSAGAAGQIIMSNGVDTLAPITVSTSTLNVTANTTSGLVIDAPQNLDFSASPTFSAVNITGTPSAAQNATTKQYVDAADSALSTEIAVATSGIPAIESNITTLQGNVTTLQADFATCLTSVSAGQGITVSQGGQNASVTTNLVSGPSNSIAFGSGVGTALSIDLAPSVSISSSLAVTTQISTSLLNFNLGTCVGTGLTVQDSSPTPTHTTVISPGGITIDGAPVLTGTGALTSVTAGNGIAVGAVSGGTQTVSVASTVSVSGSIGANNGSGSSIVVFPDHIATNGTTNFALQATPQVVMFVGDANAGNDMFSGFFNEVDPTTAAANDIIRVKALLAHPFTDISKIDDSTGTTWWKSVGPCYMTYINGMPAGTHIRHDLAADTENSTGTAATWADALAALAAATDGSNAVEWQPYTQGYALWTIVPYSTITRPSGGALIIAKLYQDSADQFGGNSGTISAYIP